MGKWHTKKTLSFQRFFCVPAMVKTGPPQPSNFSLKRGGAYYMLTKNPKA
jgi:hypothetical protein